MSNNPLIFFKLGMCNDTKEIQFVTANGQISYIFDSNLPDTSIFSFPDDKEQISMDFHQTLYVH